MATNTPNSTMLHSPGTPTIDIDDSDDESVAETNVHESSHLLGEDLYPRYATASPRKYHIHV
jgi:hypothetical protein